jgi:phosphoglycolate phosphatase
MLAQALDATGGHEESELDRLHDALVAFYEANICVETRPYPGLIDALNSLAARGVRLGVATNKLERFSRTLLERLGLSDRFACIIGGDTLGPGRGKPAPDMIRAMVEQCGGGQAVFIGDSIYDVAAAHAAGVAAVVCRFGFQSDAVGTMGADAIIDHYDALIPTLERL